MCKQQLSTKEILKNNANKNFNVAIPSACEF